MEPGSVRQVVLVLILIRAGIFDSCVPGSRTVLKEDQNPNVVQMNPFYYNLTILILSYSRRFQCGSGSGTMALVKTKSFKDAKETFFHCKTKTNDQISQTFCAANRRFTPEEIENEELVYV